MSGVNQSTAGVAKLMPCMARGRRDDSISIKLIRLGVEGLDL